MSSVPSVKLELIVAHNHRAIPTEARITKEGITLGSLENRLGVLTQMYVPLIGGHIFGLEPHGEFHPAPPISQKRVVFMPVTNEHIEAYFVQIAKHLDEYKSIVARNKKVSNRYEEPQLDISIVSDFAKEAFVRSFFDSREVKNSYKELFVELHRKFNRTDYWHRK
jgi:hypothetical protein